MFSRENLAEAVSGGLADTFAATVLFPLDVLKLRAQLEPGTTMASILKEDGLLALWRGVSDKWIVSPQQKFQYFYVETGLFQLFGQLTGRRPNTVEHLALGYLAALQGNLSTIPLEVVLTQRLACRKKLKKQEAEPSFAQSFNEAVKKDGFMTFYKGWQVSAILCLNPAITYVVYERIRQWIFQHLQVQQLGTVLAFLAGALSKIVATLITFPFIRAKSLLNTWTKLHPGESIPSLTEVIQKILNEEGFLGLYEGIYPQLTKGVLNSAIMLM